MVLARRELGLFRVPPDEPAMSFPDEQRRAGVQRGQTGEERYESYRRPSAGESEAL